MKIGDEVLAEVDGQKAQAWIASQKEDNLFSVGIYPQTAAEKTYEQTFSADELELRPATTPDGFAAITFETGPETPWVSIRLPSEDYALLERLAAEESISLEEEILLCLEEGLKWLEAKLA